MACLKWLYSTFHTFSIHESFPSSTNRYDYYTLLCFIPLHTHFALIYAVLFSVLFPILLHLYVYITKSLSILISALLYWLDKISTYVMCLSSATPWSLLSIPCHSKCSSYLCLTYLHLFWHMYYLLLLTSPLLHYSAFKWYKYPL